MPNRPFDNFLAWEAVSRDSIDFKKIYVDMAGNLNAGLMLSEIVYWYLPNRETGESKLRVEHDGFFWIACRRYEWFDRTRLTPDQADSALGILVKAGLIITGVYKFNNDPTKHVRINQAVFMERWNYILANPVKNPYTPARAENVIGKKTKTKSGKTGKGNEENPDNEVGKKGKSLTENPALTPASDYFISRGFAATPEPLIQVIEVWVNGWEGIVSGKPYGNNTYRADAKKLALSTSLTDIKRYTLGIKEPGSKWANARPGWGIWVNDMGEHLKRHPAPDEPEKASETELSPDELARAQRLAERQGKLFGGGQT